MVRSKLEVGVTGSRNIESFPNLLLRQLCFQNKLTLLKNFSFYKFVAFPSKLRYIYGVRKEMKIPTHKS